MRLLAAHGLRPDTDLGQHFLLDENLFKLWRDQVVDKEECLMRSSKPAELAAKMAAYEKGQWEEEDEEYEDDDDFGDDDDDDDDDRRPRRKTGIRR